VCDGDGTSCSLNLRLLLQVQPGIDISDPSLPMLNQLAGSMAASPLLLTWTQSILQQAAAAAGVPGAVLQLQPQQAAARWWTPPPAAAAASNATSNTTSSAGSSRASSPIVTRKLQAEEAATSSSNDSQEATQQLPCSPEQANPDSPATSGNCTTTEEGVQCPSPLPAPSLARVCADNSLTTGRHSVAATETPQGRARQLLQAPASSGVRYVQLDAVLTPSNVEQLAVMPPAADPANQTNSQTSTGLLGIGQALALGLEQQAVNDTSSGSSSGSSGTPQLLRVMMVQRVGVCGNGVCEVGERQLLNSEGAALQEALVPCPQVSCGCEEASAVVQAVGSVI
jgi:hypothetical protein